jgi:hypothetical protein
VALRFDRQGAERAFESALACASSTDPLPQAWLQRFERLEPDRTYSAVLATALLARALDRRANARVLMVRADAEGYLGYSARGLFTKVIFELCSLKDISLGTIGREPHNNQPFFGNPFIDARVRSRVEPASLERFDYLSQCLDAANALEPEEALTAFAAFLRVRLERGPRARLPDIERLDLSLPLIQERLRRLVAGGSEGGARGEAVVAAALDLVHDNVRVNAKRNDPSRHWPGDVVVLLGDAQLKTQAAADVLLSAEVKERSASPGEILQFARNLQKAGIRRGLYALLDRRQGKLPVEQLNAEAWERHDVDLHILIGIDAVVDGALAWTGRSLDEAIPALVRAVAHRLEEKEAVRGLEEWTAFLGASAGA